MILINTDSTICAEYYKILSLAESLLGSQYSGRFKTIDIWKDYDDIADDAGNNRTIGEVKPNPQNSSSLIIHLPRTFDVENTANRCLFAHEIIHTLRPSYDLNSNKVRNTYLEEGLAVWFQYYYQFQLTKSGLDVDSELSSFPNYLNAYNFFMVAYNTNSYFIKDILDGNYKQLCAVTPTDLSSVCHGIQQTDIQNLLYTFPEN